MKNLTPKSLRFIPAALGLLFALLANHAGAAIIYWDNNGASTPGNGTWDTTTKNWNASSTLRYFDGSLAQYYWQRCWVFWRLRRQQSDHHPNHRR